ncbi:hypothetical protein [Sphingobium sp.]|uniref:hypothetical protein n=1 Tax=Sphingobium sp. TaxID=1912891 RepID=UPI003B3AC0AB
MWKTISFRHPLRRRPDANPPAPEPAITTDHPFADLMAKLDRIPYRRTLRRALDC